MQATAKMGAGGICDGGVNVQWRKSFFNIGTEFLLAIIGGSFFVADRNFDDYVFR